MVSNRKNKWKMTENAFHEREDCFSLAVKDEKW